MLALARGEGQSIIIDGNIEVKIVKWSRSSVRLAIQAPREVSVDRDEIWRKMHPGEMTPLEKAEVERNERFAREAAAKGVSPQDAAEDGTAPVTAPIAGVFYGSAGPGGAPYVTAGSTVEEGTLIGSIRNGEAVSDVRAGLRGTITRVAASNGQHVTAGQVLVIIKRAAG